MRIADVRSVDSNPNDCNYFMRKIDQAIGEKTSQKTEEKTEKNTGSLKKLQQNILQIA